MVMTATLIADASSAMTAARTAVKIGFMVLLHAFASRLAAGHWL